LISLTKAPCNLVLEIKSFAESFGWAKRLESMGIRKGQRVRKIASKIDVEVVVDDASKEEAVSESAR
jgi:hypothetical protein